ncbi:MAG: response regulator, partial [Symploca sp. SIO2B6]|nr:response regulator [Symploca sp. SIO2B6]
VRISYQNQPNGVIMLQQCDRPRQWTDQDKFQLTAIAGHIGIALAQARLLENEKHQRKILDVQNLQLQDEIRQRERTEQALKQAKEVAETANRAKSEFLANMSHELRTPLNAILGFTQVLERMDNLSSDQQDYLEIINRCGNHLLALINDVLEMSKIEAGQVELYENSFDLSQLLHTIRGIVQLKTNEKDISLSFIYPADYPRYVVADESKLRQILLNLLDNAVKFTNYGDVQLSFSVEPAMETVVDRTEPLSSLSNPEMFGLRFEVKDTGPGIADNELDLLFQAFAQTEAGKKHSGGTGLGLAITQKFVMLMGGRLLVDSEIGAGTIFHFTIPVRKGDRSNSAPSQSIDKLAPDQKDCRILIAEDNQVNQKLLVHILQGAGFRTQLVDNGEDAIQALAAWNPHLILMDISMPKMDGLSATRLIRTRADGQTIPILALTAYVFKETQQQALRAGCHEVLSKPIQRNYLLQKIADYLGLKYQYYNDNKIDEKHSSHTQQGQSDIVLSPSFQVSPCPHDANSFLVPPSSSPSPELLKAEKYDELSSLVCHLNKMSEAWTQELKQAATIGSDQKLLGLVKNIPPSNRILADALTQWINDFRFDDVIKLTNRAM